MTMLLVCLGFYSFSLVNYSLFLHSFILLIGTLIERSQGKESNNDKKISDLSKMVAVEKADKTLTDIRVNASGNQRSLPSKAYCRNSMEAYPNCYEWKHHYYGISRDQLWQSYQETKERTETSIASSSASLVDWITFVEKALDVVKYDLSHDAFKKSFDLLNEVSSLSSSFASSAATSSSSSILSVFHELLGTYYHLLFKIEEATKEYEKSLGYDSSNINAHLKFSVVLLENGERENALSYLNHLLSLLGGENKSTATSSSSSSSLSASSSSFHDKLIASSFESIPREKMIAYRSWIYNHRATLVIARDENGQFVENALEKALNDLEAALNESGK
jgi:tetratricopeptide (TPR) repeat protein